MPQLNFKLRFLYNTPAIKTYYVERKKLLGNYKCSHKNYL